MISFLFNVELFVYFCQKLQLLAVLSCLNTGAFLCRMTHYLEEQMKNVFLLTHYCGLWSQFVHLQIFFFFCQCYALFI
jgi:hypothetical protein